MKRTQLLQETRKMHFEEILNLWTESRLTQEEAARMLCVSDRAFRRYIGRYNECGLDGLLDKRLTQVSARKAPVDEVMAVIERYKSPPQGMECRNTSTPGIGARAAPAATPGSKTSSRRPRRSPREKARGAPQKAGAPALPGMMIHQDGSTHEWVPGKQWDLIVTMDDATNEHYSMFFTEEEGTSSSFAGVKEVILSHGLFCAFYSDRGSHYWHTPEAGGKIDRKNLTQFGRAMHQLGIEMIPAYSPEARGRSERAFATHQDRLVKELAFFGITEMAQANRYLREHYLPAYNAEFKEPANYHPMVNSRRIRRWMPPELPPGQANSDNSFAAKPDNSIC